MRNVQPLALDDLDKKILGFLQQDGRMTFVTLAAHLGVSEGTIRKRVKRLEDGGVLKTMGVTDPLKMGLDTVAFIWFRVDRLYLEGGHCRPQRTRRSALPGGNHWRL